MYYDNFNYEVYGYDSETERTLAKQRAMLLLLMNQSCFRF